jgi:hypothetical protein
MPSVDRLTMTEFGAESQVSGGAAQTRVAMSHVPDFLSKLTAGSVARAAWPAGVANTVRLGRKPPVQDPPSSVEVAQPMFDEPPPLKKRPAWNVATTVLPDEYMAGSTSV